MRTGGKGKNRRIRFNNVSAGVQKRLEKNIVFSTNYICNKRKVGNSWVFLTVQKVAGLKGFSAGIADAIAYSCCCSCLSVYKNVGQLTKLWDGVGGPFPFVSAVILSAGGKQRKCILLFFSPLFSLWQLLFPFPEGRRRRGMEAPLPLPFRVWGTHTRRPFPSCQCPVESETAVPDPTTQGAPILRRHCAQFYLAQYRRKTTTWALCASNLRAL